MAPMLNAKTVESAQLPPGKSEAFLYDGDNLALRLRPTSDGGLSKVWLLRYSFEGKRKKLSLGTYPLMGLAEAREAAAVMLRKVTDPVTPVDPQVERLEEEARAIAAAAALAAGEAPSTFAELYARFKEDYLQRNHTDGGSFVDGIMRRHVLDETFAKVRIELLRPAHVRHLMNTIHDKGLTRTCGVAFDTIRQAVGFAIQHDWLGFDPTIKLSKTEWDGDAREVERALEDDEIIELTQKLYKSSLPKRWQHAVLFMLGIGTRIEETMLIEKAHIDMEQRTLLIPAENQKKRRGIVNKDYTVYLSAYAVTHLKELLKLSGESKYVFPARLRAGDDNEDAPADHKTLTKALHNHQCVTPNKKTRRKQTTELVLTGGTFTPHDLRRSFATFAGECGVRPEIIDKCLNHTIPDKIQRTYNRAQMRQAMREAFDIVGAHLAKLVARGTELYENERDGI